MTFSSFTFCVFNAFIFLIFIIVDRSIILHDTIEFCNWNWFHKNLVSFNVKPIPFTNFLQILIIMEEDKSQFTFLGFV